MQLCSIPQSLSGLRTTLAEYLVGDTRATQYILAGKFCEIRRGVMMFLLYRPMCELWPTNRLRFMSLRESVITKSAGFCSPTVGHSRQSASDRPGLGLRRRSFLRTSLGATALHLACRYGQLETARLLIGRGADVNSMMTVVLKGQLVTTEIGRGLFAGRVGLLINGPNSAIYLEGH